MEIKYKYLSFDAIDSLETILNWKNKRNSSLRPMTKIENQNKFFENSNLKSTLFSTLENEIRTGNEKSIILSLKKFYSLTSNPNFPYIQNFQSTNFPQTLIGLLGNPSFVKESLKILVNLTSIDEYCSSFPNHEEIFDILFKLFVRNIKNNPDISLNSINCISNFVCSSEDDRNLMFQYILTVTKYAQTIKSSEIKKVIFKIVCSLTLFPLSLDQYDEVRNTILLLLDYVDESTILFFTLTIRKLSHFSDFIYNFMNTPIFTFLENNLSSTHSKVVALTIYIYEQISRNECNIDAEVLQSLIPDIPKIAKFISSSSTEVVKSVCFTLVNIIKQCPYIINNQDIQQILDQIMKSLISGKGEIKNYLLYCLIFFVSVDSDLVDYVNNDKFKLSLMNCLESDDEVLLLLSLKFLSLVSDFEDRKSDEEKAFVPSFAEDETVMERLNEIAAHKNSEIAQIASKLVAFWS